MRLILTVECKNMIETILVFQEYVTDLEEVKEIMVLNASLSDSLKARYTVLYITKGSWPVMSRQQILGGMIEV